MIRLFAFFVLALLAACQTIPRQPSGFSARQVEVLKSNEFESVGDHWELGLGDKLLFESDESELVPAQNARLRLLSQRLVEVGITSARVEGHTDAIGAADYNMRLSQRRAESVRMVLMAGGMAAVEAVGRGEAGPVETNRTTSGRRENRRVVILISPPDKPAR